MLAYVAFLGYTAILLWCAYRRLCPAREPAPVFRLVPAAPHERAAPGQADHTETDPPPKRGGKPKS